MVYNDHAPEITSDQQEISSILVGSSTTFLRSSWHLSGALFRFFKRKLEIDELVNGPHRFASATFSRAYNKGDLVGALNKRYSWAAAPLFIKPLLGLRLLCKNPQRQRNHAFTPALITLKRGCFFFAVGEGWEGQKVVMKFSRSSPTSSSASLLFLISCLMGSHVIMFNHPWSPSNPTPPPPPPLWLNYAANEECEMLRPHTQNWGQTDASSGATLASKSVRGKPL